MKTHVMIDFETWGTARGSALRSIGAVAFDPFGSVNDVNTETFYQNVKEEGQLLLGLTKDPSTVTWWSRQDLAAQNALLSDQISIEVAAAKFNSYLRQFGGQKKIWAQGSNFDPMLWEAVCEKLKLSCPWQFYNTRDTRTVYDIARLDTRSIPREGTYHNALDDCHHQVKCVQMAVAKLYGK